MSIKKGRFYLTFKSSLIAFFLIKFFVNYSQPFCNLTATLQLPFWFAMVEYLTGVILFAMFVNALYLRYKE